MPLDRKPAPMDLRAFWTPCTANFRSAPRLPVAASGMHGADTDARPPGPGTSGRWCRNAGHTRLRLTGAIIAMSPPPIIRKARIAERTGTLADVRETAS
ncbi:hypothetical protein [Paracoccus salsus]|uniref:hypothetical protein n=1 Tax=Paracoccus salsus TaxID=2911061 RepID=UPI001F3ED4C8|nr:hypothetical protein [Paracoccus salsus]MCF3974503.1 hypothetical protein [Paracoccus salsus]